MASAPVLSQDLAAIFDANNVPEAMRKFLVDNKVVTVRAFAVTAAREDLIDSDLIAPSGVQLSFGEKVGVKTAWIAARAHLNSSGPSASSSAGSANDKMPDGSELRLRTLWKEQHGIFLNGGWLVCVPVMTKLYTGLLAEHKSLYVPGIENIRRQNALTQQPLDATVITSASTGSQVFNTTFDVSVCTTHPEFFLRFRAYIASISLVTISTPEWFPFESMLLWADMIFDLINCRTDRRRPSLEYLCTTFMAMFGDYALQLQNHGRTLDNYFQDKAAWTHLWKDSINSWDDDAAPSRKRDAPSPATSGMSMTDPAGLPSDLQSVVATNNSMLRALQGSIDKRFRALEQGNAGNGKASRSERRAEAQKADGNRSVSLTPNNGGNKNDGGRKGGGRRGHRGFDKKKGGK